MERGVFHQVSVCEREGPRGSVPPEPKFRFHCIWFVPLGSHPFMALPHVLVYCGVNILKALFPHGSRPVFVNNISAIMPAYGQ